MYVTDIIKYSNVNLEPHDKSVIEKVGCLNLWVIDPWSCPVLFLFVEGTL